MNRTLVVHDWKVLAWEIHDLVYENIDYIPPKYLGLYIKACWASWLNRGPEMVEFEPHTFLVVSDRKNKFGKYWRNDEINNDIRMSNLFHNFSSTEYKGNRNGNHSERFNFINNIGLAYLRKYDLPYFEYEGFEADDFAGAIYRIFKSKLVPPRKVLLHTSDRDWSQLVDNSLNIYWANVRRPNPREFIQNRLASEFDVIQHTEYKLSEQITHPSQLPIAKSKFGDLGDNLPVGTPEEYFDLCNAHPKYSIEKLDLYPELVRICANNAVYTDETHLEKSLKIIEKLHLESPIHY